MSILRQSEVIVRKDCYEGFMDALQGMVKDSPLRYDALEAHCIAVDRGSRLRVLYVTQWRDEAALKQYAGPRWETEPVTFPEEEHLLESPMRLRHFDLIGIPIDETSTKPDPGTR